MHLYFVHQHDSLLWIALVQHLEAVEFLQEFWIFVNVNLEFVSCLAEDVSHLILPTEWSLHLVDRCWLRFLWSVLLNIHILPLDYHFVLGGIVLEVQLLSRDVLLLL